MSAEFCIALASFTEKISTIASKDPPHCEWDSGGQDNESMY